MVGRPKKGAWRHVPFLMAPGSQEALASLCGAAPAYRRFLASAHAIPSLDELGELQAQLQTLRADADARLNALLAERGKASHVNLPRMRMRPAVEVKREEEEARASGDADAVWGENVRPGRTYGRMRRAPPAKGDGSSSDLDSGPDSDTEHGKAPRRSALGFRLKMNVPDARRGAEPARSTALLDTEPFVDDTTFSWDAPADVGTSVLPQCEPAAAPAYYPTHPLDVHDDFANKDWRERDLPKDAGRGRQSKDTTQVPATTFMNYADAYFKPVTEDDLAWLSSKNDDPYPFQFPELGTHYRKVWEKEDAELQGLLQGDGAANWPRPPRTEDAPSTKALEAPSALSLSELRDAHMYNRTVHGGRLLERLASALLLPRQSNAEVRGADAGPPTPPPDAHKKLGEIEAQARQEGEAIGLLDTNVAVQWQEHADGPIASALRLAQRRLREQIAANERRKARLFAIAQDRMAYQDYQACLAAVDREIEAAWTKRQRQIKASMGKKRKGAPEDAGPTRPQLPDTLGAALARRKQLKAAFEPLFDRLPHARAPPRESIYQGLA